MARITYYKNSFLASVFSVLASLMGMGGGGLIALGLLDGELEMAATGAVLLVIAFGLGAVGGKISANKSNTQWWKNQIQAPGRETEIINSVNFCFQVYNANPNNWTLNKIQSLNPMAASQIRQSLGANQQQNTPQAQPKEKNPGNKNATKWFLVLVAAVLAVCFYMNWKEDNSQTEVYDLSTYSYTELENRTIYKAEDLVVVDCFAYVTETGNSGSSLDTRYYLVLFRDRNDRLVGVNMPVNTKDKIYYQLLAYCNDDSQQIGDCVLDCYIKTRSNSADSAENKQKMDQYFEEALVTYSDLLGETIVAPDWAFSYHCPITQDPLAK